MVRRIYKHDGQELVSQGEPAGLMTDGYGGFLALHPSLSYRGWYQFSKEQWRMQKILESLEPLDEGGCTSFYYTFYGLRRVFETGAKDSFRLYGRSLLYETSDMNGRVRLTLDHRDAYEGSRLGRIYDVLPGDDSVTIVFRQYAVDGSQEYEHHMILRGVRDVEVLGNWREVDYATDRDRNAKSTYWVYDALTFLPSRHVIIGAAYTDYEARTVTDVAFHHREEIISTVHMRALEHLPDTRSLGDERTSMAMLCASNSLLSLHQHILSGEDGVKDGLFAGLPWFFQIWSRDELISLGGLIDLAAYMDDDSLWRQCTGIIDRHMGSLLENGLLPNRHPHSDLPSIDAIGWLARRVSDLIAILQKNKRLFDICSIDEMVRWHAVLSSALSRAKSSRGGDGRFCETKDGVVVSLFHNESCETWMDTAYGDDGREGYRVEIQALFLAVYDALILLSDVLSFDVKSDLKKERKRFIALVRRWFVDTSSSGVVLDGRSDDGAADTTIRPNLFLAYYLAPDLFSSVVWKKAFSSHAEKLFLNWGGVATLSPDADLFQPHYTGEDNKSYHRGDSWYFINNLAALAMHRLARRSFSYQVLRIMSASAKDILEFGFAGHASELSSAEKQSGQASLAQTWSAATFIELVLEYFKKIRR
ncbi:MAG: amylo-alpha-1,6-glucosidase [Candidatus Woesearchaeota archaeon]